MFKKTIILIFALLLGGFTSLIAQNTTQYSEAFKQKARAQVHEFYGNVTQYQTEAYMPDYYDRLSRVEIVTKPMKPGENITPLSKVIFLNKYNPELKRDDAKNFDPENFNALKYSFNFYANEDQYYRVDGTVYVIVIHPVQK